MQKQQQPAHLNPPFVAHSNLFNAAEQLAVLIGQHALVAEQLHNLSAEKSIVELDVNRIWHSLENQVARLRFEVENFKRAFAPVSEPAEFFTYFTDSAELLFIK